MRKSTFSFLSTIFLFSCISSLPCIFAHGNHTESSRALEKIAIEERVSMEQFMALPPVYRAFLYGMSGFTAEILFTAAKTILNDYNLQGYTQIWVFPLYVIGCFGVEKFEQQIKHRHFLLRAIFWMSIFYSLEYTGGNIAQYLTGHCPWQYTGSTAFAGGILNGLHAPVWGALGLIAEQWTKMISSLHLPKEHCL